MFDPHAPRAPKPVHTDSAHDDHDERREKKRGRQRQALSAVAVHHAILRQGDEELKRSSSALAWSGLTAGLSMGFSLTGEGLLRAHLPEAAWTPLISKLGYPLGFFIVVLGRQQLFTENTLTAMMPLLKKKDARTAWHLARLWAVVLLMNLLGAWMFAATVSALPVFSPEVQGALREVGLHAAQWGFTEALIKGVFAGWLIALMVWLLPAAGDAKWIVVFVLTYVVGLAGLTHIIAGSVEVLYAVHDGGVAWSQYFGGFMIPTLLGNTIGGVLLVAALNHAQASGGKHPDNHTPRHHDGR